MTIFRRAPYPLVSLLYSDILVMLRIIIFLVAVGVEKYPRWVRFSIITGNQASDEPN